MHASAAAVAPTWVTHPSVAGSCESVTSCGDRATATYREYLVRENPWLQLQICGAAQKDKNNVIAATLKRLTNKADTSGRITNTLGDGP